MIFIVLAYFLYAGALIYRASACTPEIEVNDKKLVVPFIICIAADCLAAWGFSVLIAKMPITGADFDSVLSILSLLAAGVIAGKFAFSYHEVASGERPLATALSVLIVLLFYVLFGAVSYYSGASETVSAAPKIELVIPAIMAIILFSNTLHDYWDYLERDED
jgi:hypothetical protein